MKEAVAVSVIIPVYKVETFIECCAISLFSQTLKNVEFIFVDDCSPDGSINIVRRLLNDFPQRAKQTKIIRHDRNKGLPAARNTGMSVAIGEYIYHCDSDDWLELDLLEKLVNEAKTKNADVVWCDWFLTFEQNERYMSQPHYDSPMDAVRGMLAGKMKYNVWNKLIRHSLYVQHHILFPEGYGMGEDMTMIKVIACAKNVAYVDKALYHYVKLNNNAFTNSMSEKNLFDIRYNTNNTIAFLKKKFKETFSVEIIYFKQNVKYPFIISDKKEDYERWYEWYPETNDFIRQNPYISTRNKLLQLAAKYKQYWFLWLHYKLVFKFIYGIVYR